MSATIQHDFEQEWLRCAPYLEAALDESTGIEDVRTAIVERRAQFWPLERSAVVTEVLQYPKLRACRVWLAGGELDELRNNLPTLDRFARESGCQRIEIDARKGWARALNGYKTSRVVLTKEL